MRPGEVALVVGADGQIGRALAEQLARGEVSVLETWLEPPSLSASRLRLDLREDVSGWEPPRWPAVAFLCAAITSLEACRKDPAGSARVNVEATLEVARALAARGAFVVLLSTSLVFDGSRPFEKGESSPAPKTEYGRQKARAEKNLLQLGGAAAVVRLTKVIGPKTPLFAGWAEALRHGAPIVPFSDMRLAPVALGFATRVLEAVAQRRMPGILQVSASDEITYEQAARRIAEVVGASQELIQPGSCARADLEPGAAPLHTTLDVSRLAGELGIAAPLPCAAFDAVLGSA